MIDPADFDPDLGPGHDPGLYLDPVFLADLSEAIKAKTLESKLGPKSRVSCHLAYHPVDLVFDPDHGRDPDFSISFDASNPSPFIEPAG